MAYEYDYFKKQVDKDVDPKTWDDTLELIMKAIMNMCNYRHGHYSPTQILEMGNDKIMEEVMRKLSRVTQYYEVQKANEVYRRQGWTIDPRAEQEAVDEKFSDSIADAVAYLLFLLMLSEENGREKWMLPMKSNSEFSTSANEIKTFDEEFVDCRNCNAVNSKIVATCGYCGDVLPGKLGQRSREMGR